MKRKATGIYTTKGSKEQLVGHRAIIDGVLSVAIMKDNTVTSYVPLVEFMKQANTKGASSDWRRRSVGTSRRSCRRRPLSRSTALAVRQQSSAASPMCRR